MVVSTYIFRCHRYHCLSAGFEWENVVIYDARAISGIVSAEDRNIWSYIKSMWVRMLLFLVLQSDAYVQSSQGAYISVAFVKSAAFSKIAH